MFTHKRGNYYIDYIDRKYIKRNIQNVQRSHLQKRKPSESVAQKVMFIFINN